MHHINCLINVFISFETPGNGNYKIKRKFIETRKAFSITFDEDILTRKIVSDFSIRAKVKDPR